MISMYACQIFFLKPKFMYFKNSSEKIILTPKLLRIVLIVLCYPNCFWLKSIQHNLLPTFIFPKNPPSPSTNDLSRPLRRPLRPPKTPRTCCPKQPRSPASPRISQRVKFVSVTVCSFVEQSLFSLFCLRKKELLLLQKRFTIKQQTKRNCCFYYAPLFCKPADRDKQPLLRHHRPTLIVISHAYLLLRWFKHRFLFVTLFSSSCRDST